MGQLITLLTDFGLEDGYVASMKGVILGICPEARLIDISHLVPPQDIRSGAFVLSTVYRDFPKGTIHLAVIDPGVGTARRALAVRTASAILVGPDNGLFSLALRLEAPLEARSLENETLWRHPVSRTFHGRDIFAPVAAHLAGGVPFEALGPPCTSSPAEWSQPKHRASAVDGEVLHIDRFGNAVSNITGEDLALLAQPWAVQVAQAVILRTVCAYAEAQAGEAIALIGSSGYLEIAVNQGSAARRLHLAVGDALIVSSRRNQP